MQRISTLVLSFVIVVLLLLTSCTGGGTVSPFVVAGRVVLSSEHGLEGVLFTFSEGSTGSAYGNADGTFEMTLNRPTTITPFKEGYAFHPPFLRVAEKTSDLLFVASPQLITLYPQVKELPEDEYGNLVYSSAKEVRFEKATPFLQDLDLQDILVIVPSPLAPEGILGRITAMNATKTVLEIEEALLSDIIASGTLSLHEVIDRKDLADNLELHLPGEVTAEALHYTIRFDEQFQDFRVSGALHLESDLDIQLDVSFFKGLSSFSLVFSLLTSVEIQAESEGAQSLDQRIVLATYRGRPLVLWGPIILTPTLEFVIGVTGEVQVETKAYASWNRFQSVGLSYTGDWKWINTAVQHNTASTAPSFQGDVHLHCYAGARLGIQAFSSLGAYAGAYGFVDFDGSAHEEPFAWQYALDLGYKGEIGVWLQILRIARFEHAMPLFTLGKTRLSYGASGRVVHEEEGLEGVRLEFRPEGPSVFTDARGYYKASFLQGTPTITPDKEGYTFHPQEITLQNPGSDYDMMATKTTFSVAGRVLDPNQNPVPHIPIFFLETGDATQSDEQGNWSKKDITGTITIKPESQAYTFSPESVTVTETREDIVFEARRNEPETITLHATQDAYVMSEYGNGNFLEERLLIMSYGLGSGHPSLSFGLLQFSLAAVPKGREIKEATLILQSIMDPDGNEGGVGVYAILEPWREEEVTWNTKPTTGELVVSTPLPLHSGPIRWDITDLFTQWYLGALPNEGVLLKQSASVTDNALLGFLASHRHPTHPPRIRVTFR